MKSTQHLLSYPARTQTNRPKIILYNESVGDKYYTSWNGHVGTTRLANNDNFLTAVAKSNVLHTPELKRRFKLQRYAMMKPNATRSQAVARIADRTASLIAE